MNGVVCPVCGEDWVRRAQLHDSDLIFWLCTECDSLWLSQERIGPRTSEYLGDFLRGMGREPLYAEFTVEERPTQDSTCRPDAK